MENLPVEEIRIGEKEREIESVDTTTIARLRSKKKTEVLGKGYSHKVNRSVEANIVGAQTKVVRIDDPEYKRPMIWGTTAVELKSEEMREGYGQRWPVETNFYVGEETTATEKPRAWTEKAVTRRISLALLTGSLLRM